MLLIIRWQIFMTGLRGMLLIGEQKTSTGPAEPCASDCHCLIKLLQLVSVQIHHGGAHLWETSNFTPSTHWQYRNIKSLQRSVILEESDISLPPLKSYRTHIPVMVNWNDPTTQASQYCIHHLFPIFCLI